MNNRCRTCRILKTAPRTTSIIGRTFMSAGDTNFLPPALPAITCIQDTHKNQHPHPSWVFSHLSVTLNACTSHSWQEAPDKKDNCCTRSSLCVSLGASWTTVWGMLRWALSSSSCCLNRTGTCTPAISIICTTGLRISTCSSFFRKSCLNGKIHNYNSNYRRSEMPSRQKNNLESIWSGNSKACIPNGHKT